MRGHWGRQVTLAPMLDISAAVMPFGRSFSAPVSAVAPLYGGSLTDTYLICLRKFLPYISSGSAFLSYHHTPFALRLARITVLIHQTKLPRLYEQYKNQRQIIRAGFIGINHQAPRKGAVRLNIQPRLETQFWNAFHMLMPSQKMNQSLRQGRST